MNDERRMFNDELRYSTSFDGLKRYDRLDGEITMLIRMIELTKLIKFTLFAEFFINQSTIQLNQPLSLPFALQFRIPHSHFRTPLYSHFPIQLTAPQTPRS